MSDKTSKLTKAELLEMLAEAVRNTQPQQTGATQPEPTRGLQSPKPKTAPVLKRKTKIKSARASAKQKARSR